MQKYIKVVNEERKIVQITTLSERWYSRPSTDKATGLPCFDYFPSSTWVSSYYPKGIAFYRWLAEHGWDESEALKNAAGARGSRLHKACELLEATGRLSIEQTFVNGETQQIEALAPDELAAIMSFAAWHEKEKPVLLANEMTVFGEFFAGTLDRIYRIGDQVWIVDIKSGQSIWTEQELQISSYSNAEIDYKKLGISEGEWKDRKLATLQIGYRLNKNKYKFTEVEDKFNLFKTAYLIWKNENPNDKPREIEIPLVITVTKRLQEQKKKEA